MFCAGFETLRSTLLLHVPRKSSDPTVVLVGRPNVGKSTLFNRITGRRRSIVAPVAGTTRDALEAPAEWAGRTFNVVTNGRFLQDGCPRLPSAPEQAACAAGARLWGQPLVTFS